MAKYEVQKGRTVLTLKGTAHEGAKLELKNFSGEEADVQTIIDGLVENGTLKEVPLTDAEKEALAEAEEKRAKAREDVEKRRQEALAESEAKAGKEAEAKEAREAAILEADFDQMNKDPMIAFAKVHGIKLTGTKADEIRAELKALQETLAAPDE